MARRMKRLNQVTRAVAVVDLGQAVGYLDALAVRAGSHIAEGQRVGQRSGDGVDSRVRDVGEAASSASMTAQEWCATRRHSRVGVLDVAEVASVV